jgi:hypothetical protein
VIEEKHTLPRDEKGRKSEQGKKKVTEEKYAPTRDKKAKESE